MNKKLLMLLAAGALVITGCAGKEASKTSDQKNSPEQKENKKENTENKEIASKEKTEVKHDLAAAEKLAHLVAISGNDLSKLNEQTNLLAWITQDKSTKFNSPEGVPLAKVSVQDFVDVVNEFSDKTYSKEDVLDAMTKTKISTITLKQNNKNYTGGHSKSKYYVADVQTV